MRCRPSSIKGFGWWTLCVCFQWSMFIRSIAGSFLIESRLSAFWTKWVVPCKLFEARPPARIVVRLTNPSISLIMTISVISLEESISKHVPKLTFHLFTISAPANYPLLTFRAYSTPTIHRSHLMNFRTPFFSVEWAPSSCSVSTEYRLDASSEIIIRPWGFATDFEPPVIL